MDPMSLVGCSIFSISHAVSIMLLKWAGGITTLGKICAARVVSSVHMRRLCGLSTQSLEILLVNLVQFKARISDGQLAQKTKNNMGHQGYRNLNSNNGA